jgi:hypothetical protein
LIEGARLGEVRLRVGAVIAGLFHSSFEAFRSSTDMPPRALAFEPHAGLIAVRELDASGFERTLKKVKSASVRSSLA